MSEPNPNQEHNNQQVKKPEGVPFVIPVLPLQNTTLFPETMVPLSVARPGSMPAGEAALSGEAQLLASISVRPERTSEGDARTEDLYEVGTLVQIKRMERVEETLHLIVQGIDRVQLMGWEQTEPFLRARLQVLPELEVRDKEKVEA